MVAVVAVVAMVAVVAAPWVPTRPEEGLEYCSRFEPSSHLDKSQKMRHLVSSGNSQSRMGTLFPHNAHARRGQKGVAGHSLYCCKRSGAGPTSWPPGSSTHTFPFPNHY